MHTTSFTHIRNNYTAPTFKGIQLPFDLIAHEVPDLNSFPYSKYRTNIVLFRLSGEKAQRQQETALIKKALVADTSFVFFIVVPFHFEKEVNLSWVYKQIDNLRKAKQNFEVLDLDTWLEKHPHATFSEAFKSLQQVIAFLCTVYNNSPTFIRS